MITFMKSAAENMHIYSWKTVHFFNNFVKTKLN